jgi:small-conductance mechanosensitive channel
VWPRLGLDPGASAALQSLSYYVLVVLMTLMALQVINVPLTLFTFVGGALAIGIGFGSQNIVNNFISGLILLAERPIKVGDLVELGSMQGTVEAIGARSTRVRSSKNIHVIVPNSHFLEQEVVNWTLLDDSVKTSVAVGVAYGSPPERVRDLLVEAVSHHEKIFTTPAPAVLFQDFAESALTFEVFFWVRIRSTMEKLIIESDVRYRIEQLFRGAGIVIAFPQRDVHLEAVGPLEVRVRRE